MTILPILLVVSIYLLADYSKEFSKLTFPLKLALVRKLLFSVFLVSVVAPSLFLGTCCGWKLLFSVFLVSVVYMESTTITLTLCTQAQVVCMCTCVRGVGNYISNNIIRHSNITLVLLSWYAWQSNQTSQFRVQCCFKFSNIITLFL